MAVTLIITPVLQKAGKADFSRDWRLSQVNVTFTKFSFIDNTRFEQIVHIIYPTELQLNKANSSHIEAAFLDFDLSIHNDTFVVF